jgi:hypothetical protein
MQIRVKKEGISIFCCARCSEQQCATIERACVSCGFWKELVKLPLPSQKQVHKALEHFSQDVHYPSLRFECVNKKRRCYSIRINQKGGRILGYRIGDDIWKPAPDMGCSSYWVRIVM